MRKIANLFFVFALSGCITVYSGGSSTYTNRTYTVGGYAVTTEPPAGLPAKDDTENRLNSEEVQRIMLQPRCPEFLRKKKVSLYIRTFLFSALPYRNNQALVTTKELPYPAPKLTKLLAETGCDVQVEQILKWDPPPESKNSDYIVRMSISSDQGVWGSPHSRLYYILTGFTLSIVPFIFNQETAYYVELFDKQQRLLDQKKITIRDRKYAGLFTLFLPFWWGDQMSKEQKDSFRTNILLNLLAEMEPAIRPPGR